MLCTSNPPIVKDDSTVDAAPVLVALGEAEPPEPDEPPLEPELEPEPAVVVVAVPVVLVDSEDFVVAEVTVEFPVAVAVAVVVLEAFKLVLPPVPTGIGTSVVGLSAELAPLERLD